MSEFYDLAANTIQISRFKDSPMHVWSSSDYVESWRILNRLAAEFIYLAKYAECAGPINHSQRIKNLFHGDAKALYTESADTTNRSVYGHVCGQVFGHVCGQVYVHDCGQVCRHICGHVCGFTGRQYVPVWVCSDRRSWPAWAGGLDDLDRLWPAKFFNFIERFHFYVRVLHCRMFAKIQITDQFELIHELLLTVILISLIYPFPQMDL